MSKLTTLDEALLRLIEPGISLHLTTQARAATRAVQRLFRGRALDLTLIMGRVGGGHGADLLASGLVRRVIAGSYGAVSRQYTGRLPQVQRALESGQVQFSHWSFHTLIQRLIAGGQGLPFALTQSLAGSDMACANPDDFKTVPDPFGGPPVHLMRALHPDVAVLHAQAADEDGNVILLPPAEEGAWGAKAARRAVLVTAEEIVDRAFIRRHSHLVQLPGRYVTAVAHVPYGALPGPFASTIIPGLRGYGEDEAFNAEYFAAANGTPEALEAWLEQWVYGPASHAAFLEQLGSERLQRLHVMPRAAGAGGQAAAPPGAVRLADIAPDPGVKPCSDNERVMTLALRQIMRRDAAARYEAFLVGAGLSEVPATAASIQLAGEQGRAIDLIQGHGFYGFDPVPGRSEPDPADVLIITDAPTIYGTYMAGRPGRTLAILGAGQVDVVGNLNSTLIGGQILSGSGGSNDAASTCDVVVVTRLSRRKLVATVDYITCPGTNVVAVITESAIFEQRAGKLVLTRVLEAPGADRATTLRTIADHCGWPLEVAADLTVETPPTPRELGLIRKLLPSRYD